MYRREGGVEYRAEQNSPIESPPDWDLINLIDFTASFTTPCHKESFQPMPMKMQSNNIAPTTSVIGSWMEEEIKPLKSVLESLQGLNPADLRVVETLLAERGSGLNTPPPLPILSDISDCISPADSFDSVPVVVDIIPKEEKSLSPYRVSCGESPLRDQSIENTVNLRDLLHNFAPELGLLDEFGSDPYYLGDDQKQLITESYNQPQQLGFEDSGDTAVNCVGGIADSSLLYLPSVCLEEPLEEAVVEDQKKPLLLELNNNFDIESPQPLTSSPEIVTISIEEFNLLTGADQREAGLTKSASASSFNQTQAPPRKLLTQSNSSAALSAQDWSTPQKLAPPKSEKKPSSASSRKRRIASLDKESDEYKDKRARNNESVRKSRDKAKHRQEETEGRLYVLSTENRRLQDRVDSLEKELSVLRGLFSSSSAAPLCM